jgi:hypothetical protein
MEKMKFWLGMLVLVFGMTVALTGCATARGVMHLGDNTNADIGESEIMISSPGRIYENADMTVTLDGKLKGIMRGGGTAKFVVPNGEHILKIDWKGTGTR